MEHFPGVPHEPESKGTDTDKNGTSRRRSEFRVNGLAQFAAEHNKKDEKDEKASTPKRSEPPRLFSLIERPDTDAKPETPTKRPEGRDVLPAQVEAPAQPVTDETGRVIGQQPHAELADDWSARGVHEAEVDSVQQPEERDPASERPDQAVRPALVPENTIVASQEDYDQWAERELTPDELYGGEVIDLEGSGAERVVDLRTSAEAPQPIIGTESGVLEPERPTAPIASAETVGAGHQAHTEDAEAAPHTAPETDEGIADAPEAPAWFPSRREAVRPAREVPHRQHAQEAAFIAPAAAEQQVRTESYSPAGAEALAHQARPVAETSQEYASMATSTPERTVHTAATGAERPVTKRDMDDAVYRATRAGVGRGLMTGLLIGGGYEHFKHKRREKKAHKKNERRFKKLDQARNEYKFASAQQNLRQTAAERHMNAAEQRYQKSQFESKQQLQQQAQRYESRLATAGPNNASASQERFAGASAERQQNGVVQNPEQRAAQPRTTEQIPTAGEGYLRLPEGHRVDTSGAFIAELDKTGKLAEAPAIAHYQEFYRELAQEAGPQAQRNAAAGEIALVAASIAEPQRQDAAKESKQSLSDKPAGSGGGADGGSAAPSGALPFNLPSAASKGAPSPAQSSSAADADAQKGGQTVQTQKPLWPLVVTLVAIVIVILFLAR